MTKIFAHRGSAGTHPENTMAAFKEAERVGADGVEIDIHLSKDNQIVVIHDATLDRTTDGLGKVRDLTLKQLKQLNVTHFSTEFRYEKIPALSEVLSWMEGNSLTLNIEVKSLMTVYPGFEERIVDEIRNFKLEHRIIFSSFNHHSLHKLHTLNPYIESAILYSEKLYEPYEYAKRLGAEGLHSNYRTTSKDSIIEARNNGVPMRVYTVNDEKEMEKFIRAGCEAIITDFPEKALQIREQVQEEGELSLI